MGLVLLAIFGYSVSAEEPANSIESSESDNFVTVQPNGYFEFPAEHHLNKDLVTYGDLVDVIFEITEEKLNAFQDSKRSAFEQTITTNSESNTEQVSSRPHRTWKRRILVLLDGERVTGTADRDMKIEEHLGTSIDMIESLEGFLSTDTEINQTPYPRVLNFATKESGHQESDVSPEDSDPDADEEKEFRPDAGTVFEQPS